MKSITLIAPGYPSENRQVYVFIEQLVNELVDNGITINVIASQSISHSIVHKESLLPIKNLYKTNNGNTYFVYRPYKVSLAGRFPKLEGVINLIFKRKLRRLLNEIDSDVIYCHFWSSALIVSDYALKYKKPLFVACGEGDNAIENMMRNISKNRLEILQRATTGVVSVSTENKRKCIDFGLARTSNITVLPNCVNDKVFCKKNNFELRKLLGVSPEDFLVIFVGSFVHRKGPNRVAEAINLLNDKNIKSIFVGKPFDYESLDPNCNGIVYKGPLKHNQLPEYLNAADVFVLPTLKEGCCNAIVEALACGLPVISANRAFNDDILNNENSIRVNPEDIYEIRDAIRLLKEDKELYKRKKEYAVAHSKEYSISVRAHRIIEFINNLL